MGLLKEFKDFATRGSVVDLAVGVIIGGAFGTIVKSLVDDILMPPIGWAVSKAPFDKLSFKMPTPDGKEVEIFYGKFLNNCISFAIIAFSVFMMIKIMNTVTRKKEEAPKPTRTEELLTEIRDALKKQPA